MCKLEEISSSRNKMGPKMITAVKKRGNDIEKEDLGGGEEGALSPNSQSCCANGSQGCFPNLVTSSSSYNALARWRIARLLVCLELFIEFQRKLSLMCTNLYLTAFRFYALLFANSTSGLNTLVPTLCLEEFGGASQSISLVVPWRTRIHYIYL